MTSSAFYTASDARAAALGRADVLAEINIIDAAIQSAISAGALSCTVGPSSSPPVTTGMTNDSVYFNAWANAQQYTDDASNVARSKMEQVMAYYVKLSYGINRKKIDDQTQKFNWYITY